MTLDSPNGQAVATAAPAVSIIVPTRDRQLLLMETLDSIRNQTFSRWELIVVDDSSSDGTARQMLEVTAEEPRIRYIRCRGPEYTTARGLDRDTSRWRPLYRRGVHAGRASACRNLGFAHARGEYLIFLDSDDCLAPWCLRQRVEAMQQHPEMDFMVFLSRLFRRQWYDLPRLWNRYTAEDDLDRLLRVDPPWSTESAIWRRDSLRRVPLPMQRPGGEAVPFNGEALSSDGEALRLEGPWDPHAASWQDWELHIRALAAGLRYCKVPLVDAFHRISEPARPSITRDACTRPHLYSRFELIAKLYAVLEQRSLLSDRRREIFAGLYFHHAETALRELSQPEAVQFWSACPYQELISHSAHAAALFYFQWARIPRLRWRLRALMARRWPWIDVVGRSTTHLQAPVEDQAPTDQQQAASRRQAAYQLIR